MVRAAVGVVEAVFIYNLVCFFPIFTFKFKSPMKHIIWNSDFNFFASSLTRQFAGIPVDSTKILCNSS